MTKLLKKGDPIYITEQVKGGKRYVLAKALIIRETDKMVFLSDIISLWDGKKITGTTRIGRNVVDHGNRYSSTLENAKAALSNIVEALTESAEAELTAIRSSLKENADGLVGVKDLDLTETLYGPPLDRDGLPRRRPDFIT